MAGMPTSFAQAANCLTADEAAAERVRRLQTTLMIGALQCRNRDDVKVADIYNQVVRQYGPVISAHNQILTRYFQRTHGSGYQRAMDRHVTAMANVIARAAQKDPGFCGATAEAGLALLAPDAADIVDQAQWTELVAVQGVDACEPVRSRRAENAPAP
ncbi:MAG: hypothetical protein Tsb0016_26470 [Sphingomonadales bacterium]